jgi:threonine dehydrogenase-like Zn-dependent dehydrogenase
MADTCFCRFDDNIFLFEIMRKGPEALAKKLPMALFHEGIGIVEDSKHPDFQQGDKVVIVP